MNFGLFLCIWNTDCVTFWVCLYVCDGWFCWNICFMLLYCMSELNLNFGLFEYIWKYRLFTFWVCLFVCEGCFCRNVWNICYCIMCVNNSWGFGLFSMCVWIIVEFWAFFVYLEIQTVLHFGMFIVVKDVFVELYEIYVIVLCVWIIVDCGLFLCIWNVFVEMYEIYVLCYCIMCVNSSWIFWAFYVYLQI